MGALQNAPPSAETQADYEAVGVSIDYFEVILQRKIATTLLERDSVLPSFFPSLLFLFFLPPSIF